MNKEISKAEKAIREETQLKEKPVAIRIAELKMELSGAISSCKLPPCVIEPILANIYNQVAAAAEKELAAQLEAMEKEEG